MILFYKQDAKRFTEEKFLLDHSFPGEVLFADKIPVHEDVKVIVVNNEADALEANFERPLARVVLLLDERKVYTHDHILQFAKKGVSQVSRKEDGSVVEKVQEAYAEKKNLNFFTRQEEAVITSVTADHKMQIEGVKNRHMVGKSSSVKEVLNVIRLLSQYSGDKAPDILVRGERGSGKEVIVQTLCDNLPRAQGGVNVMNMAAINKELMASTLFGHVKGAFTGAVENKEGMFAASKGKVLYMDEIGELPLEVQAMLLRAIEYREYIPVGGTTVKKLEAQLLLATNKPLEEMVANETFRGDLFDRLRQMMIVMTPLRARKEDTPLLVQHFLGIINSEYPSMKKDISPEAVNLLSVMDWEGNVREVQKLIFRLHVAEPSSTISVETVSGLIQRESVQPLEKALPNIEILYNVAKQFGIDVNRPTHLALPESVLNAQQQSNGVMITR